MEKNFKKGDRAIFAPADRTVYVYTGEGIEAPWAFFAEGNVYTVEGRKKSKGLLLLSFYGFEGWFDSGAFDPVVVADEPAKGGFFRAVLPFAWEIAKIWIKNKLFGGSATGAAANLPAGGISRPSPAVYASPGTIAPHKATEGFAAGLRPAGKVQTISRGVLKETRTYLTEAATGLPAGYLVKKEGNAGDLLPAINSPLLNSSAMTNDFGISATKAGLTGLASVSRAVVGLDANNDGNVDGGERAQAAAAIFPALFPLVTNFVEIRNETRKGELTPEEKAELLNHIVGLDLLPPGTRNDVVEEWIDDTIRAVLYNQRYIKNTLEVFRPAPAEENGPEVTEGGF